jgi:alpha-beta hydrolase superfamily lysophospholipase
MPLIPARAEDQVKASTFSHISSDSKAISVRKWLPAGAPKAILLVAHGMAEHAARYGRLAEALVPSGWAVYAPDHRGHGATAAPGELGWLAEKGGFARIRDDLHEISLGAVAELGQLPVFLLGHSMGSVLAETYLAAYGKELSGCVLSGVVAPPPPFLSEVALLIAVLGSTFKGQKAPAKSLHGMSFSANNKDFEPARTEADWLSRDAAEVDKYVADPLCGFVCSFGFYRDFLSSLRSLYYAPTSPFSGLPKGLPVYILAGAEDPVGGAQGFVPVLADKLKAAGLDSVETRLYPGARHEILNETNRDEVIKDIIKDIKDWLDAGLAKAKS